MKVILDYIFWCLLAVLSRTLPHLPDANALTSLCLLAGWYRSGWQATGMIIVSITLSNVVLSYLYGWPLFGLWTVFMYSGFIAITLSSHYLIRLKNNALWMQVGWVMVCSSGYWVWSNLGVWLGGWYGYSTQGFIKCYIMALPYLSHALLGDVCWFLLCSLLLHAFQILQWDQRLQTDP